METKTITVYGIVELYGNEYLLEVHDKASDAIISFETNYNNDRTNYNIEAITIEKE